MTQVTEHTVRTGDHRTFYLAAGHARLWPLHGL
jgi:hypothetical protein